MWSGYFSWTTNILTCFYEAFVPIFCTLALFASFITKNVYANSNNGQWYGSETSGTVKEMVLDHSEAGNLNPSGTSFHNIIAGCGSTNSWGTSRDSRAGFQI